MTDTTERPVWLPPAYDDAEAVADPRVDEAGVRSFIGIRYDSPLGFRPLALDIHVPESAAPVPLIVYIHGGAFLFGSRRIDRVAAPIWQALFENGFAVASLEYRLSGEALFPACLQDVTSAVRWLRRFGGDFGVRTDSIGVWGESAGGHLTAFLGLNLIDPELVGRGGPSATSATVQAVVPWYPPTDFLEMDRQAGETGTMPHDAAGSPESLLVGGPIQEAPDAARFASPISHVNAGAAPMLLMHGEVDSAVPSQQSVTFADALVAAGGIAEVLIVPGADHVFDGVDRTPLITRSIAFLQSHLA